jgi:hypothetical protein
VLWATFAFASIMVVMSLIPIVFPALYASFTTDRLEMLGIAAPIDYLEPGANAAPLIITNMLVLILGILYWKRLLPKKLSSAINYLFAFEVSKKIAFIAVAIILGIYIGATIPELATEDTYADWTTVKAKLDRWSIDSIRGWDVHVNYFLLDLSNNAFGSYKALPFISSIGLLITVFYITKKITEKRFAGIVSLVLVAQSYVFLMYDTSSTYTSFWMLFYLLSLYLIFKMWPLAHGAFLLSLPSKVLTLAFFPMSLYFMWRAGIPKRRKVLVMGSYAAMFAVFAAIVSSFTTIQGIATAAEFNDVQFWTGFTAFATQMRFDLLLAVFLLPLIVGLLFVARSGSKQAESILFIIGWILLLSPILAGFTNQTNQPYRFLPIVVFFAMGVGMLLVKRKA